MKERDSDEQKLSAARKAEKDADAEYKAVHEETKDQKLEIAANAKKAEAAMKEREALKQASMPQPLKPVSKVEGTGSVWNTGSYHWEEKSVSKWSDDTLRSVLSCFEYLWNDAKLCVTEVKELKGEAGVSIRKGKKIISYDYKTTVQWRLSMNSMEGDNNKEVAFCIGSYELPEICDSEEMDDWEVRVSIIEDKDRLVDCLGQLIRGMGPKDLKKQIKEKFVDELAKK